MGLTTEQQTPSIVSLTIISGIAGSIIGLLDAFIWIAVVSHSSPAISIYSPEMAITLIFYAMGGYGILSLVFAFIYFRFAKAQSYKSSESISIAASLPLGLLVMVFGLGYWHGGFFRSVFFLTGCFFLGFYVLRLAHIFLKRSNITITINRFLSLHAIILAFILIAVSFRFTTPGWKWLSILFSMLLMIAAFMQLFQETSRHKAVLGGLLNILLIALLLFIPNWSKSFKPLTDLPQIVLITIDTLRPDHLGYYGYKSAHTPNIDTIASKGVVFMNTYAPAPRTGPSHISILTGLYPNHHGAVKNYMQLSDNPITLPEILSTHGYKTAAIISGFPLTNEASGLAHHFEYYYDNLSTIPFLPEVVTKLRLFNLVKMVGSKLHIRSFQMNVKHH